MGQGRARVCVAPGHGLLLRLDDPDCGRAPPRVGRRPPRIDLHRGSDWQVARRPEHHAVRIRLEPTIGPSRDRCAPDGGPGLEQTFAWSYVNGPASDPEDRTVDQVIDGVTKNESPMLRPKTLPENGPENGAFTVAPAPTVRGTLIVIVVSSRPSGDSPGVSG